MPEKSLRYDFDVCELCIWCVGHVPLFDMTHRYLPKMVQRQFYPFFKTTSKPLRNSQDNLQKTSRKLSETIQTTVRHLEDTSDNLFRHLTVLKYDSTGWLGGWSPLHNHTTLWPNLQVENLQELKWTWVPSWARVWQLILLRGLILQNVKCDIFSLDPSSLAILQL